MTIEKIDKTAICFVLSITNDYIYMTNKRDFCCF